MKTVKTNSPKPRRKWAFSEYITRPVKRYLRNMGISEFANAKLAEAIKRNLDKPAPVFCDIVLDTVLDFEDMGLHKHEESSILADAVFAVSNIVIDKQ